MTEDDYTKGHEIGQGSAGTCYNALNNNTGKVVILKTLDLNELDKEAVELRVKYIKENLEKVK